MSIQSQDYKTPASESGKGNVSADIQQYTFTGAEAADTTVLLRRMSENNTYARITAIADAGIVALTEVDLGYVAREDGESDDLVAFGDGLILTTANQSVIADLKAVDFKHDIAMTIKVNNAGNDGLKVKFLVEFINVAG